VTDERYVELGFQKPVVVAMEADVTKNGMEQEEQGEIVVEGRSTASAHHSIYYRHSRLTFCSGKNLKTHVSSQLFHLCCNAAMESTSHVL
jgi:hypothetical protein